MYVNYYDCYEKQEHENPIIGSTVVLIVVSRGRFEK